MQSDISVLVIEDEEIWARRITHDLKQFGFTVVGCLNSVEDALTAVTVNDFDVVLLDINLNGKNSGIALGKFINQTIKKPFIFITGSVNHEMAGEAASVQPSAFLTKPFNPASLYVSIQSAIHHFSAGENAGPDLNTHDYNSFFVKVGKKYTRVDWRNVVYLQSAKNYTIIITSDNASYMIRNSLQKTLQDIMPEAIKNGFVQINRGDVVNKKFITEVTGDEIITKHKSFTITEAYFKNLKQQLNVIL